MVPIDRSYVAPLRASPRTPQSLVAEVVYHKHRCMPLAPTLLDHSPGDGAPVAPDALRDILDANLLS